MAFFGLILGLDLEMRAAHPLQKFQGVPPPGANVKHSEAMNDEIITAMSTGCGASIFLSEFFKKEIEKNLLS